VRMRKAKPNPPEIWVTCEDSATWDTWAGM
jgi:hypothetical protein